MFYTHPGFLAHDLDLCLNTAYDFLQLAREIANKRDRGKDGLDTATKCCNYSTLPSKSCDLLYQSLATRPGEKAPASLTSNRKLHRCNSHFETVEAWLRQAS